MNMNVNMNENVNEKSSKKMSFLSFLKKYKSNDNNPRLPTLDHFKRSEHIEPDLMTKKPALNVAQSLDETTFRKIKLKLKLKNGTKSKSKQNNKPNHNQCHTELPTSSPSYASWMKLHEDHPDANLMELEANTKCMSKNDELCRPCKRISFLMDYYKHWMDNERHSDLNLTVNVSEDSLSTFMDGLPGYSHIQLTKDFRHLQIFHRSESAKHQQSVQNEVDYSNTKSLLKYIYLSLPLYTIYRNGVNMNMNRDDHEHDEGHKHHKRNKQRSRRQKQGKSDGQSSSDHVLSAVSKLMMDLKTKKDFNTKYMKLGLISQGANGKIYAVKTWKSNEFYAMKEISFKNLNINILFEILRNWKMVQQHELIGDAEMFVDGNKSTFLIVVHLYKGSTCELLKEIYSAKQRFLTENELRSVLKNGVLKTLKIMHSNGYIHGDIKPENIVYEYNEEKTEISTAIIDYDLSMKMDQHRHDISIQWRGTLGYSAPEWVPYKRVMSLIDNKVDIYSLGLTMLLLLCGQHPFLCPTAVREKLQKENPSLDIKQFVYETIINNGQIMVANFLKQLHSSSKITDDLYDLLQSMLKFNPSQRCDISEVMQHQWFNREE